MSETIQNKHGVSYKFLWQVVAALIVGVFTLLGFLVNYHDADITPHPVSKELWDQHREHLNERFDRIDAALLRLEGVG